MSPPATPTASSSPLPAETSPNLVAFETARMEALAQLAGGIAPALSDLLTVIRGQAGRLLDGADHDAAVQEPLNQIYTAAEKAGNLLRQLQIFSRQQTMQAGAMDLNGLIEEIAGVLHRLLGAGISVEFRFGAPLPLILADAEMIEQALIILALNARDAMPGGGRLRLTTEVVDIPSESAPARPAGRLGRFVVLTVDDTGRGIAPEIIPRIFEPFFTTKAGGRSTGLGLATVFGIVKQHEGWLTVESVVNAGSSFHVFLPVAPSGSMTRTGRGSGGGARSGNETILLVEDDAGVREFTAIVLKDHGYRVLQSTSGAEALEAWKWHAPRIRLLLTDMVLEDQMSGLDLAAKLRVESPSLKVICCSGYRREAMQRFPDLAGGYQFLQKPCRPQTLVAAVRALLDEQQP